MNTIVGVALKLDSLLHLFTIWGLFSKIDFSETVCRRSSIIFIVEIRVRRVKCTLNTHILMYQVSVMRWCWLSN